MLFDNAKGQSRKLSHRQLPPPAPVLPKMEGSLPTRANATKKYKHSLIAEVNEAINQGINTTSPISVGVSKYNPAVVNEVISLLTTAGWDVTGINIDGSYSTIILS
ncbi:hypothetical protein LACPH_000507 [Lacticaseibacillus parahuelsenbergensis]|uniref:Uncharacterized protein n=1 Tax=Lacticaseibacillus parahuelsenbergensis TaxID=3068305 RepID=A0ABY9L4L1_9LACO|nr:hypothetical protein [Lacticaseibacillus sp. NCIMB 15471]WLV78542.1 hypothetical protein LACPH_000507 [Lacticaseibacillus sp. NCIMB 15471]